MVNPSPPVILIVEDEALIRMCAVAAMTDAGFFVIEAIHAADALAILHIRAGDIRVLFTDIHMPGAMDGLGLAHHAARHWPQIAVLITSGKARFQVPELPDGCRFVSKPYDPDHVIKHIQELVGPNRGPRSLPVWRSRLPVHLAHSGS
jgi:DNA-binding NtrC family response regulator